MVFSSLQFIFVFLPVFLVIYFLIPNVWRNCWIFVGSIVFYGVGTIDKPHYALLLIFSVIVNFFIAKGISRSRGKARGILNVGIIYNLAWLCIFKYSDFIFENINALSALAGGSGELLAPWNLLLPVGISFYTFQSISYIIDVYRKEVQAETSFVDFGAYLTMFPQLIAGPIVKYRDIRKEMKRRSNSAADLDEGLRIFALGLGLKVLLANRIGSCWSDIQTIGFESISAPVAWMGIFAYSFQLYFDFYGYSMMAIGLGKMMGFNIPQNFDHPYESLSMTEFWRRWHMTLGSWFREYVYIPLGGNRRRTPRVIFNLFVVWLLTGFWHGAGWNFIIWGVGLFIIIAIEKAGLKKILDKFKLVGHLYMLFLIPLSWMVFAITDVGQIGVYIQRLLDFGGVYSDTVFEGDFEKFLDLYGVLMVVCAVLSVSKPARIFDKLKGTIAESVILLAVFWGSIYCLYIGLNDPFLYFRF